LWSTTIEATITLAEEFALDRWLMLVSHRCELVVGDDLDTIAQRIESSGRMTACGLRRMLATRWRAGYAAGEPGCSAVRAARWILAEAALSASEE